MFIIHLLGRIQALGRRVMVEMTGRGSPHLTLSNLPVSGVRSLMQGGLGGFAIIFGLRETSEPETTLTGLATASSIRFKIRSVVRILFSCAPISQRGFHLDSPSEDGGWIVQHIVGDWKSPNDKEHNGHDEYWEAWHIGKGKSETDYHKKFGFDDKFSGGFGTKIHAEARFYEGLKLPASFKSFGVYYAHDLRATHKDPNLPTNRATAPLIRDWH